MDHLRGTAHKNGHLGGGDSDPSNQGSDMSLSRSYSFIQRRDPYIDSDAMHEAYLLTGMRSVESTPRPQRRHRRPDGFVCRQHSSEFGQYPADGLCTPMTHRKQRSFEMQRMSDRRRSDSSSSPQSPQPPPHGIASLSSLSHLFAKMPDVNLHSLMGSTIETPGSNSHRNQSHGGGSMEGSPFSHDSSKGGADSGVVSATTTAGSRHSSDGSSQPVNRGNNNSMNPDKAHKKASGHSKSSSGPKDQSFLYQLDDTKASNDNYTPFVQNNYEPHVGSNQSSDASHYYTNMDYLFWDVKNSNDAHLLPLQQYILEQAKLSGKSEFIVI